MAKKKKQKKAGLEKRRKSKQQRRTATKKRILAQQPVQKQISSAKLKQNLKNIPSLIFEPELQELAFSPDQVTAVKTQFEKVPDQVEALADAEFNTRLKAQLEIMKRRFEQLGDTDKTMMAHAIIYFMEQENAPASLNQIIVAMYFSALHKKENTEPLELKQLNLLLREYDLEWYGYLQEKAEALSSRAGVNQADSDVFDEEEEDNETESTGLKELIIEFNNYLETELSMRMAQRDRIQEDLEVLLIDYFEEKEIEDLESVRARKIKTFLESWFITTMHPTREDLEHMIESLEYFFRFATLKGRLSEETGNEILQLFADKETLLSNLNT
jgi:hypothetical protein